MILTEIKAYYQKKGYAIAAFIDHSWYVWHKELLSKDFLPVGGREAVFTCLDSANPPLNFKLYHIIFFAMELETAMNIPEPATY